MRSKRPDPAHAEGQRTWLARWLLAVALSSVLAGSLFTANALAAGLGPTLGNAYPLDAIERVGPLRGPSSCHPKQLVFYRGTHLKLDPPSLVFEPFVARLERFEATLAEIGVQVYGRAPSQMAHVGTYVCRTVEPQQWHLSEHAFGNAIDVTAFRFPPLDRLTSDAASRALPRRLKGAFTLSVLADYYPARPATEASERHQRFFALLNRALRERALFRTAIGPADARHRSHLHLDMAPWPYLKL